MIEIIARLSTAFTTEPRTGKGWPRFILRLLADVRHSALASPVPAPG
jgi:hypothetical protein